MASVQSRELPWSWERSPGWRGQYERLRRWRARLCQAAPDDVEVLFDFVLAFFTACYHLSDWLLQDEPSIQTALDELFATSTPLRLSADIVNIAKHFDLIRPPCAGRQLSFAREYVPGGKGWFGSDGRLVVLSGGEKIDVLDLVADCEEAWTDFIRKHGRLGLNGSHVTLRSRCLPECLHLLEPGADPVLTGAVLVHQLQVVDSTRSKSLTHSVDMTSVVK